MRFRAFTFLSFYLFSFFLFAQGTTYPVTNYGVNTYGAANQNWGIALDDKEHVFVANHQGLLIFDGLHWELEKLPNNTIVRSVYAAHDRVYTGSYEEFGYWKQDAFGDYQYTSLTQLIDSAYEFRSEEFWEIVEWNNKIVFRSFRALYIYDGKSIQVVEPNLIVTKIIPFQNQLILGTENNGVYSCASNHQITSITQNTVLANTSIADIALLANDTLLIGTKYQGVYTLSNRTVTAWRKNIHSNLKEDQLNKIAVLNAEEVVFGTIKNGLLFYNRAKDKITYFNRSLGLQNNTILGFALGKEHLWVAQDNGISSIDVTGAITFFNDLSGQLGTVYDVKHFNGVTYLGSNTGVFYIQDGQLKFLEGSQGHVWGFSIIDGKLLCNHNDGLFQIKKDSFTQINGLEGTYEVVKIPNTPNTYLASTYIGISKLVYENDVWNVTRFDEIGFPVNSLLFEDSKTIWCTHPYKGVYRMQFDDAYTHLKQLNFNDHKIKVTSYKTRIHKIDDQIAFYVANEWYVYKKEKNEIESFSDYKKFNGYKLIFNENESFWFINSDRDELQYISDTLRLRVANSDLLARITPLYEKIFQKNGHVFSIPLNDGFANLDLLALAKDHKESFEEQATLESVATKEKVYPISQAIDIPYSEAASVTIDFGLPYSTADDFSYSLHGPIDQLGESNLGTINLQNLTYGHYILKVFMADREEMLSYSFAVLPPWYLSKIMIIVYILLGVLGMYLLFYFNVKSIKRYQKKLQFKMEEEEAKRKAELDRISLQKEIELKQKELMNSTLIISKKNELLLELKNELKRVKDNTANEYRVKSLIAKTTDAISNEEDWEVFETNFNELHDDYFKKMIQQHPKLTTKDLKLCAYLKMGLMSKEIAPLMGISTRGVELHRYRLRKKLGLTKEQDLTKYVLSF